MPTTGHLHNGALGATRDGLGPALRRLEVELDKLIHAINPELAERRAYAIHLNMLVRRYMMDADYRREVNGDEGI
jgi:hypothetical protein